MKRIFRMFSFLGKEINEVRRQPRLVLGLLLGPFLILILFGWGYIGKEEPVRISLVVPPDMIDQPIIDDISNSFSNQMILVNTWESMGTARFELSTDEIDMIGVIPEDFLERIENNEPVSIRLIYNEIDPRRARFFRYVSYLQIDTANEAIMMERIDRYQGNVGEARRQISETRETLEAFNRGESTAESTQSSIEKLVGVLNNISSEDLSDGSGQNNAEELESQMDTLTTNLNNMSEDIERGQADIERNEISRLTESLSILEDGLSQFTSASPTNLVDPVSIEYEYLRGEPLEMMVFFAPRAIILILQHIGVTLGALSLVREKTRGTIEFLGATPISMEEVVFGKYFAYLLFLSLITAGLIAGAVFLLNIPFEGRILPFTGFSLLFLLASIGLGFLISVLSNSETQAVQLVMLALLFTIFFSGFIMPNFYFKEMVNYIAYIVPVTAGLEGYQSILLIGSNPDTVNWIVLGVITVFTFILVLNIWKQELRSISE